MGKEILNKILKKKTVGKSGCTDSGRVTIDGKELNDAYTNHKLVDIEIKITEHDDDQLVQEIPK